MIKLSMSLMLLLLSAPAVFAQTVVPVQVTQVSLETTDSKTALPYLVLEIPVVEIPKGLRLEEAVLEFQMDVARADAEGAVGETATLEIYPFSGTTTAKLNVATLGSSSMKRTVNIGIDRRIRLYATDFVQKVIDNPNAERRLIVGSVAGNRSGRFTAKSVETGGSKALLTVYFSPIEEALPRQTTPSN